MKKLFCLVLTFIMLLTAAAIAESGFAGGNGTKEDLWQIASAEQLQLVRENLAGHYVLVADIDLSGYENWEPIGAFRSLSDAPEDAEVPNPDYAFTGTFDGAGHTITNLTVSAASPMGAGLFGCATERKAAKPTSAISRLKTSMFPAFIWSAGRSGFSS